MLRWFCEASAQGKRLLGTVLVYDSVVIVGCAATAGVGIDVLFIIVFSSHRLLRSSATLFLWQLRYMANAE